jgi:hypothetical protein
VRSARDRPTILVVVVDDGTEVVVGRVDAGRPDLALVDALARLHLSALRCGWALRVVDASPPLCGLLGLVGLADVLALEPLGEPELREELGVEEVMEPGDAPA